MKNSALKTALQLAERGIPCFPLQANKKTPLKGSHGCKDATCDPDQLRAWFADYPDRNVGAATGNGLVVIDVDNKRGKNGSAAWQDLLPDVPSTLISKTPNDGMHYWFRTDENIQNSVDKLGVGIDVRSDGGYVVVPPSFVDGKHYEWETDPNTPIPPLPPVVLNAILNAAAAPRPNGATVSSGKVMEGGRNDHLFRYACRLRGADWDHAAILSELHKYNRQQCQPRLPKREVEAIAKSVLKYPSNDALTETGNAARFHARFGDVVRYAVEAKQWLVADGGLWRPDTSGQVVEYMKDIARELKRAAANETGARRKNLEKWAKRSESASVIRASLTLAQSISGVPVNAEDLDADPMLLALPNGVLDLYNGELLPHDRTLLLTRQAGPRWDPEAECPRWLEFLDRIFARDASLIAYLKRLFGYALTGRTSEQAFVMFHGNGRNGKSTLLLVLRKILGDYARHAQPQLLTESRYQGGPNPSLARLRGARLVTTTETEENQRLSESLVKQITGSDPIEVRGLYQDPFEFVPAFKIILATNHMPKIRGNDDAIWRRIHLVPFDVAIPESEVIPDFDAELLKEASGILRWMVEGCLEWQEKGLAPPEAVLSATGQYRAAEDVIGNFLTEAGFTSSSVRRTEVYSTYSSWAHDQGFGVMSTKRLYAALRHKGFQEKKVNGTWYFAGLPTGGTPWRVDEL